MSGKVTNGRGYVYSIQLHLLWCTKHKEKILRGNVEEAINKFLLEIARTNGFDYQMMKFEDDHIHLIVNLSPQHYIPNVIKALKGTSARLLFKEYPELKDKLSDGHLWNPSYFVASDSEHICKQIEDYMQNEKTSTKKYNKRKQE